MTKLETTKAQRAGYLISRHRDGVTKSLCRDVDTSLAAVRGLMEIAEQALPDTFFATDSRVQAARDILGEEEPTT